MACAKEDSQCDCAHVHESCLLCEVDDSTLRARTWIQCTHESNHGLILLLDQGELRVELVEQLHHVVAIRLLDEGGELLVDGREAAQQGDRLAINLDHVPDTKLFRHIKKSLNRNVRNSQNFSAFNSPGQKLS
mgnify:CR=1 FL=1